MRTDPTPLPVRVADSTEARVELAVITPRVPRYVRIRGAGFGFVDVAELSDAEIHAVAMAWEQELLAAARLRRRMQPSTREAF